MSERDQLFFGQIYGDWMADEENTARARANTFENFKLAFDPRFMNTVIGRVDMNEALFKWTLDDDDFREAVKDWFAREVYRQARRSEKGDE